jgi:hypothetical protein
MMIDFKKAEQDISLVAFLKDNGYTVDQKKTGRNYIVLEDKTDGDSVVVTLKNHREKWFEHHTRRSDGLIEFIKSRIHKFGGASGNIWADVNRVLEKYMTIPQTASAPETTAAKGEKAKFDVHKYKFLRPVHDFTILKRRGLSVDFLKAAAFRGKILNNTYNGQTSIIFPIRDRYEETNGLDIRTPAEFTANGEKTGKYIAKDSDLSASDWTTHIAFGTPIKEIIVCESPVDALSYAQLRYKTAENFDRSRAQLKALHGSVREYICADIRTKIAKNPGMILTLANDNDIGGMIHNINLLKGIFDMNIEVISVKKGEPEHELLYSGSSIRIENDAAAYHRFLNTVTGTLENVRIHRPPIRKDWNLELQFRNLEEYTDYEENEQGRAIKKQQ